MSFYEKGVILIAFLLPAYLVRFSVAGIPTTLLEAAVWAVALSGFFQAKIRRSWINTAKAIPKPILFLVGLFFLSAVISTVISPHLETSLGILKGWIVTPLVYAFLVYAALTTSSASPRVGFSFSRRSTSPYEGEVSAHTEGEVYFGSIICTDLLVPAS